MAGGVNVLDDPRTPEYPRISMETVIRLAPDVIVDAGDMGETAGGHPAPAADTEGLWQQQTLVKAARDGRVHRGTSERSSCPARASSRSAETLARWFHGVRGR